MKKILKIATYCIIGTAIFAMQSIDAKAAETPVAGINVILNEFYQINENEDISKLLEPVSKSEYDNIAIAKVTDYMNIRSKASEDSKIKGKLYNGSAATILDTKGDWYKIKSGTVTGYIKSNFVVTGKKAESLAKTVGKRVATVTTTTLKVREEANLNSAVLTLVPIGEELIVKKEMDEWIQITIDADIVGYVSAEYVEIKTEFDEAKSIEEEQQEDRLEESNTNNKQNQSKSQSKSTKSAVTKKATSTREKIVQYALQFVGNPYVWGGTSLTHGADCSGFTQSVFRDNGISIPRTSREQAVGRGREVSTSEMQPGDLIFYDRSDTVNHVGIYIGNGKIVSASNPENGIRVTNYNYRQPYKIMNYID